MKNAIYKPKGKAKEYGDFACNLYTGCGFCCTYPCYAQAMAARFGNNEFFTNPQPREGIIERLKKDAKKLAWDWYAGMGHGMCIKEPPFVFLCFSCDAYQPINKEHQLTRQAIETLHRRGIGVNILTKGIITDFDLLGKMPHLSKVGITLTGANRPEPYEPLAAAPNHRMNNITEALDRGIETWLSAEPVIDPAVTLADIKKYWEFFDEIKIGKWNHSPEAKKIDWYKFGHQVEALCRDLGVKYYIKEDLRKEMNAKQMGVPKDG